VRLGSPALTTLGMGREEMREIAKVIHSVLAATRPGTTTAGEPSQVKFQTETRALDNARASVAELLAKFPLYPQLDLY
jgi:glycine hydroxymethyltransferase